MPKAKAKETPTQEAPEEATPAPQVAGPKTQPEQAQGIEAKLAALQKERDEAVAQVNSLTGKVTEQEAATTAAREALIKVHRAKLYSNAIDPDISKLGPELVISPENVPTADSLQENLDWIAARDHLFRTQGEPVQSAPPAEVPQQSTASTPPVDKTGQSMTLDKWKRLEQDNPREFRQRWPEYVAYMAANQNSL